MTDITKQPHRASPDGELTTTAAGTQLRHKGRWTWTWLLGGVLVLAAAGFGAWYWLAPPVPAVSLLEGADAAVGQAVASARWAVRRSPWSDGPRGRLAMLLQAHARHAEAAVYYSQAEQLNPAEPRWPYLHAFVVADDPPTAQALRRRAAELAPPGAPDAVLLRWADTCLEQGLLDDAERGYCRLLTQQPEHPRAHLGLARLANRREQFDEALTHLESCTTDLTTRKAAAMLRAEIHLRRGEPLAAARANRQISEWPDDVAWRAPGRRRWKGRKSAGRPGSISCNASSSKAGRTRLWSWLAKPWWIIPISGGCS
jgi:tetratricopeptide (TPR) repeat protein